MNPYSIAPLISFIFLLAGAFYVFKKGTRRIFNWLFAFAIFILSIIEFGNFMVLISPDKIRALFWQRWTLVSLLFLPFFWTLVSLVFARENYRALIKKWIWYLAGFFALILWFLTSITKKSLISDVNELFKGYGFVLGPAGRYLFVFLLLSLIVILLNFENTYRFSKDKQRQIIKYAIRGIGVFIGSYIFLTSLALLFSYIDVRFTVFGSIATVAGFLLVARSILRYGLTDIDVYVGRQAIYTSATLSIIGLYLVMVGIITKLFMKLGFNLKAFLSFLAAFFVFSLFISLIFSRSLSQRLRLFIDHSLYKNKYDYRREWGNLSERLGAILNIDELINEVKNTVKQILHVDSVHVLLENIDAELTQWLLRYGGPISIEEFSQKQPGLYEKNKKNLQELDAHILVSLNAKQKLIGILIVGKKVNRGVFSNEDMELLKIISRQVSIAVLNARLSEELIISKELEHFHKLSSFLIHDLKNFVSMLSMVVQNAGNNFNNPKFQRDSLVAISDTITRMSNLMQKLSSLPKSLELKTKPINISILIEETIKRLKLEDIPAIRLFKLFNYVPQLRIDAEYIQKVIQNLIMNAIEAMPNGGNLTVKTNCQKGIGELNGSYVQLTVSDTGCGMSQEFVRQHLFKPFQSSKHKGLGIGLFQCKTIIEAHDGQILVESEEGKGTNFIVKLPVNRL